MAHVNSMLREQLDQATAANQALTADIHKLTQDWQRAREELEAKEAEWREEEQVGAGKREPRDLFMVLWFPCSRSTSTSAPSILACCRFGEPSLLSVASSRK